MQTEDNFFEESKERIQEYVKDRILLLKLEAVEKISRLTATIVSGLLITIFSFFIILFVSIMVGYLIGEALHHAYWGFAIVAGIYVFLLVLIVVLRKQLIEKPIINAVIDVFFEKKKHNDKQQHDTAEKKEETHEQ